MKMGQVENFKCWMYGERMSLNKLDLVLEFMKDQQMLNTGGKRFEAEVRKKVCGRR